MPAAIALLRPLLAEREAQYADLFIEIGDFLFLRGESAEVRPWWIGCVESCMQQADVSGGSASHDCAAAVLLAEHEAHYVDLFAKIGGCANLRCEVADVHVCMF